MSKIRSATADAPAEKPDAAPPATVPPAPVERVVLDEFCRRLSTTDRRVELIAAFHFTERDAGRTSDTEQQYQARYEALIKKPV